MLALIAVVFSWQQNARQNVLENNRAKAQQALQQQNAQDEALQAYLDQMSSLLLEKKLRESKSDSEVRTLARARTLTVLGTLDPSRKSALLRFLVDAKLVQRVDERTPVIILDDADLGSASLAVPHLIYPLVGPQPGAANLSGASMLHVNLSDADLSDADLSNASLAGASLTNAFLPRANLRGTFLNDADLSNANLSNANLDGANLRDTTLSGVNLSNAYLSNANLLFANLSGADLSDADLSNAWMAGASLTNAVLRGADLSKAGLEPDHLSDADLSNANLRGAYNAVNPNRNVNEELAAQAASLEGATMPDGQKYEDWLNSREEGG
jgi:uncharacterized protein YjbI with pentapeptide repeats